MRNCIFIFLFILFALAVDAQTVRNVKATQEGQKIAIAYELVCTQPTEINLFLSEDNGKTWSALKTGVSGDVGSKITQGNKVIYWDVLQSKEKLVGNAFVFKVKVKEDTKEIKSVKIGNQVWMAENLNVDYYRNGDPIPTGLSAYQWGKTTDGALAVYNDDPINEKIYGKLYNWYAVNDPRGLCPSGWRVPKESDWFELVDQLGGDVIESGKKMKSDIYWRKNVSNFNSSGFNAFPGGWRGYSNKAYNPIMEFNYLNYYGFYWMSESSTFNIGSFDTGDMPDVMTKNYGVSVRCIKD